MVRNEDKAAKLAATADQIAALLMLLFSPVHSRPPPTNPATTLSNPRTTRAILSKSTLSILISRRLELAFDVVSGLRQWLGTISRVAFPNVNGKVLDLMVKLVPQRFQRFIGGGQLTLIACSGHPNHDPPRYSKEQAGKA